MNIGSKESVLVISIINGIITLVEPNGSIGHYRQRGISKLSEIEIKNAIRRGMLVQNYKSYSELPRNYKIAYEEDAESMLGKAKTFFKMSS